jgi:exodeoxyribonuclease VII small subunit
MAKKKSQPSSEFDDIPFEIAMEELAEIVGRLESGQETLDDALKQFERGMSLLRACHRRLDGAAHQIELVTRLTDSGDVETEAFDGSATHQRTKAGGTSNPRPGKDDSDDGSLF